MNRHERRAAESRARKQRSKDALRLFRMARKTPEGAQFTADELRESARNFIAEESRR